LKIGNNRWAGVVAVLIAGLLSPMPMFFTNWGRYTQLAGLVILPGLIFLLLLFSEENNRRKKNIALLSIILAGVALTHYRILLFGLAFLVVYLLFQDHTSEYKTKLIILLWSGLFTLMIFLPWLVNIGSGKMVLQLSNKLQTSAGNLTQAIIQYNAIGNISDYFPAILWIITIFAVGFFLWWQNHTSTKIIAWSLIVFLISNPYLLKLPGTGVTNNFAMMISAYLPNSILLGGFICYLTLVSFARDSQKINKIATVIGLLTIISIGGCGAFQQNKEIQPQTLSLVARPDVRAARWIRTHVPENAHFLVNSFLAFNNTTAVGSDAGWWLPIIADRKTNLPAINYIYEENPDPQYWQKIRSFTSEVNNNLPALDKIIGLLKNEKISYVYIGQQQGQINFAGPTLDPKLLLASNHFKLVYHQDRVWIFSIQ
jgi:hypothetical protein